MVEIFKFNWLNTNGSYTHDENSSGSKFKQHNEQNIEQKFSRLLEKKIRGKFLAIKKIVLSKLTLPPTKSVEEKTHPIGLENLSSQKNPKAFHYL